MTEFLKFSLEGSWVQSWWTSVNDPKDLFDKVAGIKRKISSANYTVYEE